MDNSIYSQRKSTLPDGEREILWKYNRVHKERFDGAYFRSTLTIVTTDQRNMPKSLLHVRFSYCSRPEHVTRIFGRISVTFHEISG